MKFCMSIMLATLSLSSVASTGKFSCILYENTTLLNHFTTRTQRGAESESTIGLVGTTLYGATRSKNGKIVVFADLGGQRVSAVGQDVATLNIAKSHDSSVTATCSFNELERSDD